MPNLFYGSHAAVIQSDIGGMRVWKGTGAAAPVPDWWDPNVEGLCIWAAYQPKGALNFAASLVDLSGTGNDAIDPGGANTPGWDAVNGWTFDGIAQYLVTTFVPDNDQSQSVLVQFTDVTNTFWALGQFDAANRSFAICPNRPNVRYDNGTARTVVPSLLAGNLGIAGDQGYRNGVADGAVMAGWGGAAVLPVTIGARSGVAYGALYIQSLALYTCVLTAPQMLAVETAMALL
jgi:hypothetical protein